MLPSSCSPFASSFFFSFSLYFPCFFFLFSFIVFFTDLKIFSFPADFSFFLMLKFTHFLSFSAQFELFYLDFRPVFSFLNYFSVFDKRSFSGVSLSFKYGRSKVFKQCYVLLCSVISKLHCSVATMSIICKDWWMTLANNIFSLFSLVLLLIYCVYFHRYAEAISEYLTKKPAKER